MSEFVADILKQVATGEALSAEVSEHVMHALMSGEMTPVQTAGLIAAMAVRGETVSEIVGFARAMRKHSIQLHTPLDVVDSCGTGGDGGHTFNISTAATFVAAAAGVPMAKHGNRAVSSRSGSADVLQALGARVDLSADEAHYCLTQTNLCFLFAQSYHPAMKYAAEPRKQLGFRTIFNVLGPLTNPASAKRQVMGVYRADLVDKVAKALLQLGVTHAMVVHGAGGIDEFSLQGETMVAEVCGGSIKHFTIAPEDVGLSRAPVSALAGGDAAANARIIEAVLDGESGPCTDVVVLNAAAICVVAGVAPDLQSAVKLAKEVLASGRAKSTYTRFIAATHAFDIAEVAQ